MSIEIKQNIPLAPLTSFKIGGPAKFFCEPKNEEEILEAFKYAEENNLKTFILGGGSNILISDEGFDGLVIRIQNTSCKIENEKIRCGSGLLLSQAVKLAVENSLTGLEWAAGIPGTIGGAIYGNAGAFGGEINENLESVKVLDLDSKGIKELNNSDCQFTYRSSLFKEEKKYVVLSCLLNLQKGDKNEISQKTNEIIEKRKVKNAKGFSTGSFFKNPIVEDEKLLERFEKDTGNQATDGKIPAGWLITEVGMRKGKVGDVVVSEDHGNFVLNLGNGRAEDVIMLASLVKMKVRNKFGVQLREEVQLVGF